jgi:hypothetical protein
MASAEAISVAESTELVCVAEVNCSATLIMSIALVTVMTLSVL